MRKNMKGILLLALGASFVTFGLAHATQTNVVLNLEGNPTCKSLGDYRRPRAGCSISIM